MSSTIQGYTVQNIAGIDPTWNDVRRADRPAECISWRSFAFRCAPGVLSAGALLAYLVNLSSTVSLLVRRVGLGVTPCPGTSDFSLTVGRAYTATPTTTGVQVTTTGNSGKHRTSFSPTGESTQLLYNNGTAITAPTRTLDAAPVAVLNGALIGATFKFLPASQENLFKATDNCDYPLILAQNEGIEINNITSLAASNVYINLEIGAFLTGWGNP